MSSVKKAYITTDSNQAEDFFLARFFVSSGPAMDRNNQRGRQRKNHMNTLIPRFKKVTPVCLIVSALACFAFSSRAEAAPVPNPPAPGVLNTRDGQSAMPFVTTGIANSAFGAFSLFSVITGNFNTAVGVAALDLNTASNNTAVGAAALLLNTIGSNNTAVGASALLNNDSTGANLANINTAIGSGALQNNVDGDSNTAVGAFALFSENATGGFPNGVSNNAIGRQALGSDTTGSFNQAMGVNALLNNTTGSGNIAVGDDAMFHNVDASGNTAVGGGALSNNVSGAQNTVVGGGAGQNLVNAGSDGNIYIGAGAGGPTDEVAFIRIGTPTIEGFPYDTYIAGIFDRDVDAATAVAVFADTNQKIGTNLVDANGNRVPFKPQALLDESLKQQERIAELEAIVERQQKGMEVLTAQLKVQAAQIQKVSAQLEASKAAPQVAE